MTEDRGAAPVDFRACPTSRSAESRTASARPQPARSAIASGANGRLHQRRVGAPRDRASHRRPVAGFLWYENHRIHRVDDRAPGRRDQTSGDQKDVENILLIGSTTRCGLKEQNAAYGLCDKGYTGVNSDVVMILHLDPDHHKAAILSIPRDTFVPNARPDGVNKIDAALGSPTRTEPTHRGHHRRFRDPHPALRRTQLRQLPGSRQRSGGNQDVLPHARLRRHVEPRHQEYGMHRAERQPRRWRWCGPAICSTSQPMTADLPVSDWPYDPQSDLEPDPARPRVPARARLRRGQTGTRESGHRCPAHRLAGGEPRSRHRRSRPPTWATS